MKVVTINKIHTRAMTLIEVMIAVAVISIIVAGIMGTFGYGYRALKLVRENQRATQILLEKVETVRLYSWTQVNSNGFVPSTFIDVFDPQAGENSGTVYTGTVTIAAFPKSTSYAPNLKQLTVDLTWGDSRLTRHRTLSTFIAKDGLQNYVY